MDSPQVSVLTLTRNRPQFLNRAIQSVMEQTLENWELIVVHDGPDPQTMALMEQWVQRDPRIRYFHRDSGGNIANACNYGLAHARGQYIAILDDDDYWVAADKLAKQVAFLDSHPDHAGCGGGMTVIDDNENVLMTYLKPEPDDEIRARALLANPMTHSTTMFRRLLRAKRSATTTSRWRATRIGTSGFGLAGLGSFTIFPKCLRGTRCGAAAGHFSSSAGTRNPR